MAFIRRKRTSAGYVYQVVRSVREGSRVRQQVLCSLGHWATIGKALEVEHAALAQLERFAAMRQPGLESPYLTAALPVARARVAELERVQRETGVA